MIDRINSMNLSFLNSLNGSESLGMDSKNNIFETVLISLLSAISEKNKTASTDSDKFLMDDFNLALSKIKLNSIEKTIKDKVVSLDDINMDSLSEKKRIEKAINYYGEKHGIDKNLIKSIVKIESDFNPKVISSAGAKGLMQLMPENCRSLGINNPFNIEENIDGGIRHIKEYLQRYNGNVEMALMAYNGGPTRMHNRGVKSISDIYKMPKETQNYVLKVMNYYKGLNNEN